MELWKCRVLRNLKCAAAFYIDPRLGPTVTHVSPLHRVCDVWGKLERPRRYSHMKTGGHIARGRHEDATKNKCERQVWSVHVHRHRRMTAV